jgi:hypothetical protein
MARPAAMRLHRVRATIVHLGDAFADVERRCPALPGACGDSKALAWEPARLASSKRRWRPGDPG